MKFYLAGFLITCICMFTQAAEVRDHISHSSGIKIVSTDSVPRMVMTYKIITNTDDRYGYDIYANGKLLVHQPVIPGLAGVKGFLRKTDAQKVAALVIKKIQGGLMPPSVEIKELDSLKIKY